MTDYTQLSLAIENRLAIVANHDLRNRDPKAHLEKLKSAATHLDDLIGKLPEDTDPLLSHYLQRQSYTKAAEWLRQKTG